MADITTQTSYGGRLALATGLLGLIVGWNVNDSYYGDRLLREVNRPSALEMDLSPEQFRANADALSERARVLEANRTKQAGMHSAVITKVETDETPSVSTDSAPLMKGPFTYDQDLKAWGYTDESKDHSRLKADIVREFQDPDKQVEVRFRKTADRIEVFKLISGNRSGNVTVKVNGTEATITEQQFHDTHKTRLGDTGANIFFNQVLSTRIGSSAASF